MLTELNPQAVESAMSTEVVAQAKRRRFTAAYKAQIVRELEACSGPGEVGAVLRREGLYSSVVSKWRRMANIGTLQGLQDKKRGRRKKLSAVEQENEELRRENSRLKTRLGDAEVIIDTQKKFAELLNRTTVESDGDKS